MTAYQLAIKLDRAHPEVKEALGWHIGGVGNGNSLAQYLANQLSKRIKSEGDTCRVERGVPVHDAVTALLHFGAEGQEIRSSLTGTGVDLSLYRRSAPTSNFSVG